MRAKFFPSQSGVLWFIAIVLIIGELWVALDGRHYWHDVRFLYATTEFSLGEILSGAFNPHQAWTVSNESSASGFYGSKMLHVGILSVLFTSLDPSAGGVAFAVFLSVLLMGATLIALYHLYLHILQSENLSVIAVLCVLAAPIIPYLSGKFLSENSSLLFVALSLALMAMANRDSEKNTLGLALLSGVIMALAGLSRLDSLIGPAGYFIAATVAPVPGTRRSIVLRNMLVATTACIVTLIAILGLSGFYIFSIYEYFQAFVGAGQKSILMSLIGMITMGGLVYILAVFGVFSTKKELVRFFTVWLLIAMLPILIITWNYMVEPRYLVQALLPLCGLGALGLEKLWARMRIGRPGVYALIISLLVIGSNYILVRLMPYELDRPALLKAVSSIRETHSDAVILVPWSYTDYNFLHVVKRDPGIFNVNSSVGADVGSDVRRMWDTRFNGWYGEQYISGPGRLYQLLTAGPVYYLGWKAYPPVQSVRDLSDRLGWDWLVSVIDGLNMKDHRMESWVWNVEGLDMSLSGRSGQYEYYLVERK